VSRWPTTPSGSIASAPRAQRLPAFDKQRSTSEIRSARLAKTVRCKLLKAIIDPNVAPVRAFARNERELMIPANNSHVLAFNNTSGLPSWLSDPLFRIASGGLVTANASVSDGATDYPSNLAHHCQFDSEHCSRGRQLQVLVWSFNATTRPASDQSSNQHD
jgi:hypothetical protein